MKICNGKKKHEPVVATELVPGRVYRRLGDGCFRGTLHHGVINDLVCLNDGVLWSGGEGFGGGGEFEDVTDYVCLDVSNLPPLENE